MPAKAIPDGHHTITPHLVIKGAKAAMDFYSKAFGAKEVFHIGGPGGGVMHGEMMIGNSFIYLCDEAPDWGALSPAALGGSPVTVHLYVPDVDAVFNKAVAAGAKPAMPPTQMFWGDRYSKVIDPFGHHWSIATHNEDVSPEECAKRAAECMGGQK